MQHAERSFRLFAAAAYLAAGAVLATDAEAQSPGVPNMAAQLVIDDMITDGVLDRADVEGLMPDDWDALRASCTEQWRFIERDRRFRAWGAWGDGAGREWFGYLSPIRNNYRNSEDDLFQGRFGAVFKFKGTDRGDSAPVRDTAANELLFGLFEGRGCILVIRNQTEGDELDLAGIAVPYDEDLNDPGCSDIGEEGVLENCRRTGRFLTIQLHGEGQVNERADAKFHVLADGGHEEFDTLSPRFPAGGQHGGPHSCFTCIDTGWCQVS